MLRGYAFSNVQNVGDPMTNKAKKVGSAPTKMTIGVAKPSASEVTTSRMLVAPSSLKPVKKNIVKVENVTPQDAGKKRATRTGEPINTGRPKAVPDAIAKAFMESAIRVLGSRTAAKAWLNEGQQALGHQKPVSLLSSESGREQVETLLGRIEYGVYT
ncbi:MAG: hypothetical protein BWZ07_01373 [Alphaproteobacteria bacterium ADurb.BinA280]|jgi:putative toxin-antitoxin system antitoxin component (TIGR02293 family)|nr:MAG: hypothetical protein BWZ07_01373 [Alphaproteobacteria bacterium ADurb.BinA280]